MATAPVVPEIDTEEPEQPKVLSDETKHALEDLANQCLKEDKTGRRGEFRRAWKQRAFKAGDQQIFYDSKTHAYMDIEASGVELPRFRTVYNIWTPHWRSFVSILSQNPPGVNFPPGDLQRSADNAAASFAEKMRHRVDQVVHMKDRQAEISSHFCTDGRTMTRTFIDAKGELRIWTGGVLESKVPLYVGGMENWGYCFLIDEVDKWQARDDYDEVEDGEKNEGSEGGEATYERMGRLGILANRKGADGYADALKDVVTKHIGWIRPSRYRKLEETAEKEMRGLYPDGVRVTLIGGKLVETVAETMDAAVSVGWPSPGRGTTRNSLLYDLTAIQEDFNDYMNMLREHVEFSFPATWIVDTVDEEAIAEQRSVPGAIHLIAVPQGGSVSDLVHQESLALIPPELVQNLDRLLTLAQFTTGDLPSLSGEGDPHSETATGQKMLSDQAKGQLSPAWQGLQWLMAQTYEKAVKLEAKRTANRGVLAVKAGNMRQTINPAAILEGEFSCVPDTDSSFPQTQADKRGAVNLLADRLGQAGDAGAAVLMHPDNLKLYVQLAGLGRDFVVPQANSRDKQLWEIEQLLQEAPVPDETQMQAYMQAAQQALARGEQPGEPPMRSSVPVGKRDDHAAELAKVVQWLSDTDCREERMKGNNVGIQNVELHADEHEAALKAKAQENAPKPEPPRISLSAAVTDPVAIAQLLAEAGVQTTPENIQASNVPKEQEMAASTQHKAAQAQHQSVLAAREAVSPIDRNPTPDQLGGLK